MTPSFLVVDKPAGITSHDVVAAVRAVTGIKKVGHTGTLDPFATGVLPLALGPATRLIQYLDESIKVYDATIQLGSATDTGDLTGTSIRTADLPAQSVEEVEDVLKSFLGKQMQTPPAYSAVKVKGKPLYHYARKGQDVKAKPRQIEVYDLELVAYDHATLRVVIHCSRGTYARVLADDIATALGSAGHLSALCRNRSGPFWLDDAISMPAIAAIVAKEEGHTWRDVLIERRKRVPWRRRDDVRADLSPHVKRPLQVFDLPLADVVAEEAHRIRKGAQPPTPEGLGAGDRFLVVCGDQLVSVAERGPSGATNLRVL